MPLTLSSHSAHSVRVINKNIRTEIFMRSCEKICELILTPRPARLTSEQAWVNKTQAVRAVMLPAMAFCGLKLSKLFSKQAHVILKQYLNKLENNEDEKQGENIGGMNEKLRKRNSSLWLELASLETERNWRCSWLEAGVLISVTSDSWGEWDNHRWHSHSTRAQNTSQQNGSREKTEQGNKPLTILVSCSELKLKFVLYLVWFSKNVVQNYFGESIDRHFAMKEESSQFSAYWIGQLCGWEAWPANTGLKLGEIINNYQSAWSEVSAPHSFFGIIRCS